MSMRDGAKMPDAEAAYYAKGLLRAAWCDHMWSFDDLSGDEQDWLRAWCGLDTWENVNTKGRCEHGFVVGECLNAGCSSATDDALPSSPEVAGEG